MARTRQQTTSQVSSEYASVENSAGVTFSKGNMLVNGQPQIPIQAEQWESSNGVTNYTTVKWRDPATQQLRCSCNCPGWAIKKHGEPRRCKHTDDMMGIKSCSSRKIENRQITTIREAEKAVPQFEGRRMRGLMLD